MAYRVSKTRFAELVQRALDEVPPPFDSYLEEISIEIRDRPTPKDLRGVERGEALLGLYKGHPRTERNLEDMLLPDMILIFQEHFQAVCDSEEQLVAEVRTTVLHEIGHHFGMSEEDLDELGYG